MLVDHPNTLLGSANYGMCISKIGGEGEGEGSSSTGLPRLVNRPGVARAVLQTPSSLTD